MEERSVGQSSAGKLEEHCVGELMEAVASKNVMKFRQALEALVLNLFEQEEEPNANDAG